ncbi:hypothetical protein BI330_22960 [Mycobacterium sp. CBMA 623]|nr:hypothetical protein [Mycobacteroides sp. CBMA 326]
MGVAYTRRTRILSASTRFRCCMASTGIRRLIRAMIATAFRACLRNTDSEEPEGRDEDQYRPHPQYQRTNQHEETLLAFASEDISEFLRIHLSETIQSRRFY